MSAQYPWYYLIPEVEIEGRLRGLILRAFDQVVYSIRQQDDLGIKQPIENR